MEEPRMILSVTKHFQLYRPPYRIGDVFELNGSNLLVIGIQDVKIILSKLVIRYVCQNLDMDYIYHPAPVIDDNFQHFEVTIQTGKENILKRIELGNLFLASDDHNWYQTIEYTEGFILNQCNQCDEDGNLLRKRSGVKIYSDYAEIIGNIYENSELLEERTI